MVLVFVQFMVFKDVVYVSMKQRLSAASKRAQAADSRAVRSGDWALIPAGGLSSSFAAATAKLRDVHNCNTRI